MTMSRDPHSSCNDLPASVWGSTASYQVTHELANSARLVISEVAVVFCHYECTYAPLGNHGNSSSVHADTCAALPRIPMNVAKRGTPKRKKPHRPDPRIWTAVQVTTEWEITVKEESDGRFTFKNNKFRSGLAIKHITSGGLELFAQDNIRPYQWVQIELSRQRGLVGYTTYIQDDKATIVTRTDTGHQELSITITLRIIMAIDEESSKLSYVKDGTGTPVMTSIYNVKFATPDSRFYMMRVGTWVDFNKGGDPAKPQRRRVIHVMDTRTTVRDEHSGEEFDFNVCDLDMSGIQGRLLPKTDLDHPVVGWRVMVSHGQLKGYIGLIKDADNYGVTVELEARLVSGQLPRQRVGWSDFTLIPNEAGASGSTSPHAKTPTPTTTPIWLTPEPDDEHLQWLLSDDMRFVLEKRCIPLTITGVSGDLAEYEGKAVRTLPLAKRKSTPKPDEVVVSASRRGRLKQISIEAKYLKPWIPIVNSKVVIIKGPKHGAIGKVGSLTDQICTVRFDDPTGASVSYFKPNKVVCIHPLLSIATASMFITKNILNGAGPIVNVELQVLMRPCKVIVDHSPELVKLLKSGQCKAIQTAMADLMQGMQNARSGDAHVLKIRASDLA
ncbi:hypothetical protein EI94DRAFT_1702256 [Lactarius quietus]|nr:hypothetical protein EI94DRAFT_1702256 [Lactarius quietus]